MSGHVAKRHRGGHVACKHAPMFRWNRLVTRHVRGCMRSLAALTSLLLAAPLIAGCGGTSTAARSVPTETVHEASTPTALTCPSGEGVQDPGGLLAKRPDGYDTREQAVEAWLEDTEWAPADADFVVAEDGKSAWILRTDETATAQVRFLRHSGFTVYGYEACSD
jgi:hypothetical protein